MKMKKWLALTLSAIMLLAVAIPAFAEETLPDTELEGFVTELVDGGFIMEDKDIGEVLLNVDDATVLDGVLAEQEIAVGLYVIVQYDGRLTRSVPPQAHADKVGCYVLNGTVSEFLESGILLTGDPLFGDVIVHVDGSLPHIYKDVPMTVYYDGIMALSMPGQVVARCVIVPELSGTVSQKDDKDFTLTDESGESYRVLLNDDTLVGELLEVENETKDDEQDGDADTADDSADADTADDAADVAGDAADAAAEQPSDDAAQDIAGGEESGDDQEESPAVTFEDGDHVTVYYNGIMTRSIPAQITALEVLVIR